MTTSETEKLRRAIVDCTASIKQLTRILEANNTNLVEIGRILKEDERDDPSSGD